MHNPGSTYPRLAPLIEKQFIDIIYQKAGIEVHDHQLPNLAKLINEACQQYQLDDAQDYLLSLQKCPGDSREFKYLADGISINESYFFRDSHQLDYIKMHYLPRLIKRKREQGNLTFRVWSAGCSEGQELYTLAILLHQQLADIGRWRLDFLGTDISNQVLETAKSARYSEWSLRTCDDNMRARFFDTDSHNPLRPFQLKPALRAQSRFLWMNLTRAAFPNPADGTCHLDIIFCRNVFIYLHRQAREDILSRFGDCLNPGGLLMLGANDPQDRLPSSLVSIGPEHRGFIKQTASVVAPPAKRSARPQRPVKSQVAPEKPAQTDDLFAEASRLANTGQQQQAEALCTELIRMDPENIAYYCLQAWLYMEQDRLADAELALRRALFLDPGHWQARFQKSLYMIKTQHHDKARKSLNRLLAELDGLPPDQPLAGWSEVSCGALTRLIQAKLALLGKA